MWLLTFLFAFVLSPYLFVFGMSIHLGALALLFLVVCRPLDMAAELSNALVMSFVLIVAAFSWYVALLATIYSHFDMEFLKLTISLILYVVAGATVGMALMRKGVSWEQAFITVLTGVFIVVLVNSIVVLAEFTWPPVKIAIEQFLVDATNIDYKAHSFRMRGAASGGGASLSVLHGFGVVIAYALFRRKYISTAMLFLAAFLIGASLMFIGRTGFIVVGIGLSVLIARGLLTSKVAKMGQTWAIVFSGTAVTVSLAVVVKELVPASILEYSIGVFLGGIEGLRMEGTVETLFSWYHIDATWAQLLFGVGDFSGSFERDVQADPGYLKTITALGLPLAVAFYLLLFLFLSYQLKIAPDRLLVALIIALLFLVEFKEPFLFQGYSARVLWFTTGVAMAYRGHGVICTGKVRA